MQIYINGKLASLKKGTSFEFVSENRSFTGSDSYSLSISFPLRGCANNLAIFGHINRTDIDKSKVVFDCEIYAKNFYKAGTITIVELNETEVKTQFLEGRSEQNFDTTFDEIYINELDLGSYPLSSLPSDPASQWQGLHYGQQAVALPWVNNASGNIQNEVVYANGKYSYHADCSGLSYQPYLIVIVKRICAALGYTCNVLRWESREDLRYLLICNTLPWAWDTPQFARALPHWSVTEFFEKLEYFLGGEFDINHKAKTIEFAFTANIMAETKPVLLDNVIDTYTAEISQDDECKYINTANIRYKECEHNMWKFYSCPWFVRGRESYRVEYNTLDELVEHNKVYARVRQYGRGDRIHNLLYAKDVDTHFVIRCIRNEYVGTNAAGRDIYDRICILQPINVFGDNIIEKDSDNVIELDFVPAWIDETEASKGNCLFLEFGSFDETEANSTAGQRPPDATNSGDTLYQPSAMQMLLNGELQEEEKAEYFDKIYIAYWDGANNNIGKLPCPTIDWITIKEDWTFFITHFSMRLTKGVLASDKYNINSKQKYTFSFIADTIPNVRSVFYINGKKYLCEKITATFTENGMSQLMKGNFYLLTD